MMRAMFPKVRTGETTGGIIDSVYHVSKEYKRKV